MKHRSLPLGLGACLALAALSLLLPFGPLFDSWAWLVWGRELLDLELDTAAGPSWKPLPVLVAAPLTLAGDAAPELWLFIVRAGWLAVPVLAWRLAARLEGSGRGAGVAAGALAAVSVVLISDDFTSWVRQGAGGLSEPVLVALVLGAIEAALARRHGLALGLVFAACLLRPEAWPFAALYAWHLVRAGEARPAPVVFGAAVVAGLWLAPDLLAADNALEGAERARGGGFEPGDALTVLGRALEMPLFLLWPASLAAVVVARRRGGRVPGVLAAGAAAWIALVAAMATAGFAGLPRFMAPAAAVVCVLGAVGVLRVVKALPGRTALAAASLALGAIAIQGGIRAAQVPGELERARDDEALLEPLISLAGSDPDSFGCRPLSVGDFRAQPPLAWELRFGLTEVLPTTSVFTPSGTLVVGPRTRPELAAEARSRGEPAGRAGGWEVIRTGACQEP